MKESVVYHRSVTSTVLVLYSTHFQGKGKGKRKAWGSSTVSLSYVKNKTKVEKKRKEKLPEFKKGAPPMNARWDRQKCSPNPAVFTKKNNRKRNR